MHGSQTDNPSSTWKLVGFRADNFEGLDLPEYLPVGRRFITFGPNSVGKSSLLRLLKFVVRLSKGCAWDVPSNSIGPTNEQGETAPSTSLCSPIPDSPSAQKVVREEGTVLYNALIDPLGTDSERNEEPILLRTCSRGEFSVLLLFESATLGMIQMAWTFSDKAPHSESFFLDSRKFMWDFPGGRVDFHQEPGKPRGLDGTNGNYTIEVEDIQAISALLPLNKTLLALLKKRSLYVTHEYNDSRLDPFALAEAVSIPMTITKARIWKRTKLLDSLVSCLVAALPPLVDSHSLCEENAPSRLIPETADCSVADAACECVRIFKEAPSPNHPWQTEGEFHDSYSIYGMHPIVREFPVDGKTELRLNFSEGLHYSASRTVDSESVLNFAAPALRTYREVGKGITWILYHLLRAQVEKVKEFEHLEHYLHPRATADLVEQIFRITDFTVIETHCEAVVLRIQRLIREGKMSAREPVILCLSRNAVATESSSPETEFTRWKTSVQHIPIMPNGDLSMRFPDGFAEMYFEETDT